MTYPAADTDAHAQDAIYRTLSHRRRRRVLAILRECPSPIDDATLATRLVAEEGDVPAGDVPREERTAVRIDLRHVQLPMLDDSGLLEWDEEQGTVTTTDHPVLQNSAVTSLVESSDESADAILSALAHRRRRLVLSLARGRQTPIAVHDLGQAIVDRNVETSGGNASSESLHETLTSLHHVHLPLLSDAGLIEFDHEDDTVAYVGYSDTEGETRTPTQRDLQQCLREHA